MNFSQPILGAGASAKTEFAAAQANAGLNFLGSARFKRGLKAELGLRAFVDASAALSKFIHASIEGTAFARAQAGIQLQLPLNLFEEFGFSARAEAIAEAAAGIEAALGFSIGDFILLAKNELKVKGLPLDLFIMFLEEVNVGGKFEINVSFTAKAHASIAISGTVVEKPGDKAGFYYTVGAGAGLAKGVGLGLKAGAEFKDFRRFYGRAVDKTINTIAGQILQNLPPGGVQISFAPGTNIKDALGAFIPISKVALRTAYELGLKISEHKPGNSKEDTARLCEEAIKVFLEEAQRFFISKILELGINLFGELIEQALPGMPPGKWDDPSVVMLRKDLAGWLKKMPEEPFQPTEENIQFWRTLISKAINLVSALNDPNPQLYEALAYIFCTSELLIEAIRSKVNKASAYATLIGAGMVSANTEPFKGNLTVQPHAKIAAEIRNVIGGTGNLQYPDLLQYLANDLLINKLLARLPEVKEFVAVFKKEFAKTEKEIFVLLLKNAGAFDLNNPGSNADPHALLNLISIALDDFINNKVKPAVIPFVLNHFNDPLVKTYLEEVLFGAVLFIKDAAIKSLLNRESRPVDNDEMTEALAGVMMLLLGRIVIVTGDAFLTATLQAAEENCKNIANTIRQNTSNPSSISNEEIKNLVLATDPEFLNLLADCIEVGGKILGPLPEETRTKLRNLLYEIFEPLPPGTEKDFLEKLADDFFIPNETTLRLVTDELVNISRERFLEFVKVFIEKVQDYILSKLEDLLVQAEQMLEEWERQLAQALLEASRFLRNLENEIAAANQRVIHQWVIAENHFRQLLNYFSSNGLKNRFKTAMTDYFVHPALNALESNPVYLSLPSDARREIRNLLRNAVEAGLNMPVLNPLYQALSSTAGVANELLPEFRKLNPNDNLPEQVLILILDKLEHKIRNQFGGGNPAVYPVISYTYYYFNLFTFKIEANWIQIPLGKIEIGLTEFISQLKNIILTINDYHNALNLTCFELAKALAEEMQLAAKMLLKEDKLEEQHKLEGLMADQEIKPVKILILSPTPLEHFSNAIPVKIHLGGVPLSYLGLGENEMQRVLIYVNGELIPPKSILIEGASPHAKNGNYHQWHFDLINNVIKGNSNSPATNTEISKTKIIPNFKSNFSRGITQPGLKNIWAPVSGKQNEHVCCNEYAFAETGESDQVLNHQVTVSVHPKTGKFVHTHRLSGRDIIHGIPANYLLELVNKSEPGILLQFDIDTNAPYLHDGVNVISVVIIQKGGNRHQANVGFTYSATSVSKMLQPGWLEIINKKTDKPELRDIRLGNLLNYLNTVKDHKATWEEYLSFLSEQAPVPLPGNNWQKIKDNKISNVEIIKTETFTTIKRLANGKEKPSGKNISISYTSPLERIQKLKNLKLDDDTLRKSNSYIKTLRIAYEKPVMVLDNNDKELIKLKKISTYVYREEISIQEGRTIKTQIIYYATDEERAKILEKLKTSGKKIFTGTISTIEEIRIEDEKGNLLHRYVNDPDRITDIQALPNSFRKEKEKEVLIKLLGDKAKNGISLPEFLTVKNKYAENPGIIPSEKEIMKRSVEGLKYLMEQKNLKFKS